MRLPLAPRGRTPQQKSDAANSSAPEANWVFPNETLIRSGIMFND